MSSLVEAKNVSFKYKDGTLALRDVSVSFNRGELVAIIGKNGSGKTTLAKLLTGMLRPASGQVLVEGKDYMAFSIAELGCKIGYAFQNPDYQLFADSVYKEVAFGVRNMGLPEEQVQQRVDAALKSLRLEQFKEGHPRRLSVGQRQGVAVASILAMMPNAVVLDEPTTGQDYRRRLEIMQFVKQLNSEGKLVILVSHDIVHVAAYCKRVIVMHEGQIIADGKVEEILGNRQLLSKINLEPTPMMQLAELLQAYGCPKKVFTIDEMADFIETILKRRQTT
jgi:energy-coupling factor transport system ATP-binding protein